MVLRRHEWRTLRLKFLNSLEGARRRIHRWPLFRHAQSTTKLGEGVAEDQAVPDFPNRETFRLSPNFPKLYSWRRATIGSTRIALFAGSTHALNETAIKATIPKIKTSGFRALTP